MQCADGCFIVLGEGSTGRSDRWNLVQQYCLQVSFHHATNIQFLSNATTGTTTDDTSTTMMPL